jgi:hypothetical protein
MFDDFPVVGAWGLLLLTGLLWLVRQALLAVRKKGPPKPGDLAVAGVETLPAAKPLDPWRMPTQEELATPEQRAILVAMKAAVESGAGAHITLADGAEPVVVRYDVSQVVVPVRIHGKIDPSVPLPVQVTIRDGRPVLDPDDLQSIEIAVRQYGPAPEGGTRCPHGAVAYPMTREEVEKRIEDGRGRYRRLKEAADQAFDAVLPEILTEAERLAREVFWLNRTDVDHADPEAREAYVAEVVREAKAQARLAYDRPLTHGGLSDSRKLLDAILRPSSLPDRAEKNPAPPPGPPPTDPDKFA